MLAWQTAVEDAPEAPLVGHVHIPKAAGQSLWRILKQTFGRRRVLWLDEHKHARDTGEIEGAIAASPRARAFTSQMLRRRYPPVLGGRRIEYVTLLREPQAQLRSFFRYAKYRYRRFPAVFRNGLPPGLDRMPLDEVATRLLASSHRHVVERILPSAFFEEPDDLEAVERDLGSFALVGIAERMASSMELLRRRLQRHGIALKSSKEFRINRSRRRPAEERSLDACPALADFLEGPLMQVNARLYDHVQRRFDAEVAAETVGVDQHQPC